MAQNQELKAKVESIITIPGIGLISAVTVIAETNGFSLITNAKQLVSYAGLDVMYQQSGSSINKKTRISKKGNAHIRKALYMPALSASKNDYFKTFHNRVNDKKASKKVGVIAVEQKLLKLIYSLWNSGQNFIEKEALNKSGNDEILDPLSGHKNGNLKNLSETMLAQN